MKHLPCEFESRMRDLLGEDFEAYARSLGETPVRAFRVNTEKISVGDFLQLCTFAGQRIPYSETGFYLEREWIGNHPYHHAGMIYVQEPGAMAPAECVDIPPDAWALDMCAAPGGKSSQIRGKLGPDGVLVSNEIIASRCRILTGNMERLGVHNTVVTCMDTDRLARTFPGMFDFIMVDAPCSGEGMFRKDDGAIDEWSPELVQMCARRQREILENARRLLRPGGTIVYATCTFSLEENEMVVDAFLADHAEFTLLPVRESVRASTEDGISFDGCRCQNLSYARRFYPHKNRGEGQFMAVLRHGGVPGVREIPGKRAARKPDPAVKAFLDDTLVQYEVDHVLLYGDTPVYFTPDFPVPAGAAFCCGVTVGEVRKNYIQPHHQFFMAMGKDFRRKIELRLDSPELAAYLRGEEIPASCENGWAVVTVDGCTVGGAKVTGGRAKNHYPKGLRARSELVY